MFQLEECTTDSNFKFQSFLKKKKKNSRSKYTAVFALYPRFRMSIVETEKLRNNLCFLKSWLVEDNLALIKVWLETRDFIFGNLRKCQGEERFRGTLPD